MADYQIDLAKGKAWTTAWRENHPTMVKAFRIDVEEINQILAVEGTAFVRAYLGYDDVERIEKLILVPVNGEGKDIVNTEVGKESNVYDFTLPCPSICDIDSPLNS